MIRGIACPSCGQSLWEQKEDGVLCQNCTQSLQLTREGILVYTPNDKIKGEEQETRDRQASAYLKHSKFPTQKHSLNQFLPSLSCDLKKKPVLDLGCGPGPSTALLHNHGFHLVTSIDFSLQSLILNKGGIPKNDDQQYICADLNQVSFVSDENGVLLMTDFLQHLGDWHAQKRFLKKALNSLLIGGQFYLSCFNLNIKNYLRGDIHGSFSNGAIQYSRIHHKELRKLLPDNMLIEDFYPMNIFNSSLLDRFARKVPGSLFLGRMSVITGSRVR